MNGQTGTPGVCRGGRDGDAGIHRRRASFLVIVCQLGNMAAPAGLAMLIGQLLNTFGAVQNYEHVTVDGSGQYRPAALLRPNA
jgi:hypothetical protein